MASLYRHYFAKRRRRAERREPGDLLRFALRVPRGECAIVESSWRLMLARATEVISTVEWLSGNAVTSEVRFFETFGKRQTALTFPETLI